MLTSKMGSSPSPIAVDFRPPKLSMISGVQVLPLYRNKIFLHEQYVESGLNISEISRLIFSSRAAVRNGLRRAGIDLRAQDELPKSKSQLRYGEALRKRQTIEHKRELAAIGKMRALRNEGFSYWKIAAVLNSMRVPTKTGRSQWHARFVQKVLDQLQKSERDV